MGTSMYSRPVAEPAAEPVLARWRDDTAPNVAFSCWRGLASLVKARQRLCQRKVQGRASQLQRDVRPLACCLVPRWLAHEFRQSQLVRIREIHRAIESESDRAALLPCSSGEPIVNLEAVQKEPRGVLISRR